VQRNKFKKCIDDCDQFFSLKIITKQLEKTKTKKKPISVTATKDISPHEHNEAVSATLTKQLVSLFVNCDIKAYSIPFNQVK